MAKARLLKPLTRRSVKINKSALVISGGVAGMKAALSLAEQGFEAYLVEKEKELGGSFRHAHYSFNGNDPQQELKRLRGKAFQSSHIHFCGDKN